MRGWPTDGNIADNYWLRGPIGSTPARADVRLVILRQIANKTAFSEQRRLERCRLLRGVGGLTPGHKGALKAMLFVLFL